MNTERHARAKQIFLDACELEGEARARYVARSCGDDAPLRAAVEELLANDAEPPAALAAADQGGAADRLASSLAEEEDLHELPERIGAYRVLRLLGRGGMGTVYEAEQENPRRRVAIKVLSVGLGSPAHLQRFRQEAQILGRLHHPGIAHVYEAAAAEILGSVQPYFVMELIEGATLLVHARQRDLGLHERLELVVQVCDAVQHAHESSVLHRDLKPSNIVVDGAGRAKVLDFGVARLLESAEGGASSSTVTGLVVGTLATMSPEQVSGSSGSLDQRSDVYSLGVIAYELLTGRAPLEVTGLSLPQAARLICEVDPPLAGALDPRLHGDPETILAKALSKDRAQRYASAHALAEDVRRYLRHEPIAARPASTFYHLRMFARRNRALVWGVVAAVLALLVGTVVTARFALRESELRAQADQSRTRAEREAYRGNVVAAGLALEKGNAAHARELLTRAGALERGWEWNRLQRLSEPWTAAFEIDVGHIWQAALLEGPNALVIGASGAVVVWNRETGARTLELPPDPARAGPVALSPDGRTALSVRAGELCLWDPRSGEERRRVSTSEHLLIDPRGLSALTRDGAHFVVRTADRRLLLFDADGTLRRTLAAGAPAFGDGGLLAVASDEGTLVWRIDDGRELRRFSPVQGAETIVLDPTGAYVAVAGIERRVHLFDLVSGAETVLSEQVPDVPTSLAFSPDGRRLAAMLADGSLWIWDAPSLRLLERFDVGRGSWKTSLSWSDDGDEVLTAAHTIDLVRIWSVRPDRMREVLRGHTSYVYPVAYTPDGGRIVSGGWDETVRIWSARTGELLATLPSRAGRVQALAVAPDGGRIVAGTGEGDLVAWDLCTGAELARIHDAKLWTCVAFAPDGRSLAAVNEGAPARIRILDAATLETRALLEGTSAPNRTIATLAFHPRGPFLAAGTLAGKVDLWDLEQGELRVEAGGLSAVCSVAFSPDGTRIAVAGNGTNLVVLDGLTLEKRLDLIGHAREVFSAAFSPDGSRVFSGGRDGLLRVWDAAHGDLLGEFAGHGDYIWCLAVSPDGTRVATSSGDFDVRQWESEPVAVTDRREREAGALELEARPRIAALLEELGSPAAVAEELGRDASLSAGMRQAALDELLRRACAAR